jgi:hypothetical protein
MIHKSAIKAGEITWNNGNSTVLWIGTNRNTGETIVWQVVWKTYPNGTHGPSRSKRITGRNIPKLAAEIRKYVPTEGRWTYTNAAALSHIACPIVG